MTSKVISLCFALILGPNLVFSQQNIKISVNTENDVMNDVIEQNVKPVVVQHAITVHVQEDHVTTPQPTPPLRTRVVVVHNNMVPVPIECFQPPDSGTCSKDLARVYYDHETRTCKPFSYTGCAGNANRFQSIKNCYRICHPYRYKIRPKVVNKGSADAHNNGEKTRVVKVHQMPVQQNAVEDSVSQPIRIGIHTRSLTPTQGVKGGDHDNNNNNNKGHQRSLNSAPLFPPPFPLPVGPMPPPPPFPPQFGPFGPFPYGPIIGPQMSPNLIQRQDGKPDRIIFGQSFGFPSNSAQIS